MCRSVVTSAIAEQVQMTKNESAGLLETLIDDTEIAWRVEGGDFSSFERTGTNRIRTSAPHTIGV